MADTTRRAVLTVAAHAKDADDCRELLDMLGITPPEPKRGRGRPRGEYDHGTPAKYSQGCRCSECRAANTAHWAEQRRRRAADPRAADRAGHGKRSTCGAGRSRRCLMELLVFFFADLSAPAAISLGVGVAAAGFIPALLVADAALYARLTLRDAAFTAAALLALLTIRPEALR